MKLIFIFALGLFTVACSSDSKEVKDMNDILPSSERDYDQKDSVIKDNSDTLKLFQDRFSILGKHLDSLSVYDEDLFPDRVGPDGMEKYRLNFEGEEVIFVKWKFADSTRVLSALFNWADCFGPNCKSIRIGEEKNMQKNAFHVFANDTVLLYLESSTQLDAKKWEDYLDQQGYELDWNYRLEQARSGRVRWFSYVDEKKTPIKNKAL